MRRHRQPGTAWLALAAMALQLALPLSAYAVPRNAPGGFGDFCSTAATPPHAGDSAPVAGASIVAAATSGEADAGFPARHSGRHAPNHCAHCTVGTNVAAILPSNPDFADAPAVQIAATAYDAAGAACARILLPPPRGPPPSFL